MEPFISTAVRTSNPSFLMLLLPYELLRYTTSNENVKVLIIGTFVNRCLRKIAGEDSVENQIKRQKKKWIGHTLGREGDANKRQALEWNPQGARRRGRPRSTWRRGVLNEAGDCGKT
jgi:hypothetical protein